ncbi:hypothetical protein ABZ647_30630 [Micromonospora aurantiaca]|uniref:hypothetical protein n=1 Tax=Micromonospora aurantiaca (nom. illeg.) TaxID=47850 RepID=UPI0009FD089F|nr:hypothetical protein [Micromonospora aurantiaca]
MFRHLDRIDPWLKRMDPAGPHERPQERSTLSRDNKEMHPYQLSQAAWHALSHAVDHLHCLRTVLKDAHVMHMYAPYSLARAALENASAAVWLLAPEDRAERVRRRLRFAALDIKGGEAVRELLGAPEGRKPAEARIEQLREIARRRGVDPKTAVRRLTYGKSSKQLATPCRAAECRSCTRGRCAALSPTATLGPRSTWSARRRSRAHPLASPT